MSLSLFFTPETEVLRVVREQCRLFLGEYLPSHLRICRAVEKGLTAPGTSFQVAAAGTHSICNKAEMWGEWKVHFLEDRRFKNKQTNKNLYLHVMVSLEHSVTPFRTCVWMWASSVQNLRNLKIPRIGEHVNQGELFLSCLWVCNLFNHFSKQFYAVLESWTCKFPMT